MDFHINPNLTPEDRELIHNHNFDDLKFTNGTLCCDRQTIGHVRVIDYKNGTHGYGISVSNKMLQEKFEQYAKEQFPNSENQYIRLLDLLFTDIMTKLKHTYPVN